MIEQMKQALEALESALSDDKPYIDKSKAAITSLRQAIAEAEKQDGDCQRCGGKGCVACDAREQEPVAWRDAAIRVGEDLCSVGPFGYYDMTAEQWLDWALSVVTVHAPPQPKREPLTLEQLREHWQVAKVFDMTHAELDFADYLLIARDVEALYGIKGEA